MTKKEFLTRFWAAYTYEEQEKESINDDGLENDMKEISMPAITSTVSHNIAQAN